MSKYIVMRHSADGVSDDVIAAPQVAHADMESARAHCRTELRAGANAYIVDANGNCYSESGMQTRPAHGLPLPQYLLAKIAALCA